MKNFKRLPAGFTDIIVRWHTVLFYDVCGGLAREKRDLSPGFFLFCPFQDPVIPVYMNKPKIKNLFMKNLIRCGFYRYIQQCADYFPNVIPESGNSFVQKYFVNFFTAGVKAALPFEPITNSLILPIISMQTGVMIPFSPTQSKHNWLLGQSVFVLQRNILSPRRSRT